MVRFRLDHAHYPSSCLRQVELPSPELAPLLFHSLLCLGQVANLLRRPMPARVGGTCEIRSVRGDQSRSILAVSRDNPLLVRLELLSPLARERALDG